MNPLPFRSRPLKSNSIGFYLSLEELTDLRDLYLTVYSYKRQPYFVIQGTITKQGKFHEVSSIVNSPSIIEEDEETRQETRKQSEMRRISRSVAAEYVKKLF